MNVYEMEGFLRGKCLPGDLKVNESNAEYLVRKLNVASGLKGELTAALATIEKCREIVGCPAGVNLQDHLRQLAAENVGLKDCVVKHAPAVEHWNAWADAEDKIQRAPETPATDRIYAGIKADGVLQYAENLDSAADDAERGGYDDAVKCLRSEASAARLFAAQLRKGAAK